MASYSRLMVTTLSEVEQYDRAHLRQGLIKSNFLPGPFTGIVSRNPLCSPAQTSWQPPKLTTLPNEILKIILGYLSPIWLFQAEAACPQIRALSTSLNSLWYENMPPALFAEPEHFQNEDHVATRLSEQGSCSLQLVTSDARPCPLSGARYYWDQSGFQKSLVVLPKISNLSELSMNVEWSCNIHHPADTRHYPLVRTGKDSIRIRNLALGGPYQPEIDYRREQAGWMHYGRRCQICALPFHQAYRPLQVNFGVLFCRECHNEYTLSKAMLSVLNGPSIARVALIFITANDQVQALPGLDKLIAKSTDPQWSYHRRSVGQVQWRPSVDDILRNHLGIDFETALAKQRYLTHLGAVLTASRRPTETNRTQLRNEIVVIAKRIWNFGTGNPLINQAISFARSRFAPTDILQCFLFPPRSLDASLLHLPFDASESWLEDPTRLLNSRDIFNRTTAWKNQVAVDMVTKLCDWTSLNYHTAGYGGMVTKWIKAADQYHVQRMEQTISADFAIRKLKDEKAASHGHSTVVNSQGQTHPKKIVFERLGVILAKLKIPPMSPVGNEFTREEGLEEEPLTLGEQVLCQRKLKLAKEFYFKKLVRACCVGCPKTGLLTFPPGYAGVVKHFREAHRQSYWTSDDWLIVG